MMTTPASPRRLVNEWTHTRRKPRQAVPQPARGWAILSTLVLAVLVAGIVAVGLRTSLGALNDAARAVHVEAAAAATYWIGVDGLIVVAIIAALVLRHDPAARNYCLVVIAVFTAASGLLQYLHGLGWFTPDPVSGALHPLPWGVVLVIALLVIGTIFCATHLFVHALRRLFPGEARSVGTQRELHDGDHGDEQPAGVSGDTIKRSPDADPIAVATAVYRIVLDLGHTVGRDKLAKHCGISQSQSVKVRQTVLAERELAELAAEEQAAEAEADAVIKALAAPSPEKASANGASHSAAPSR